MTKHDEAMASAQRWREMLDEGVVRLETTDAAGASDE